MRPALMGCASALSLYSRAGTTGTASVRLSMPWFQKPKKMLITRSHPQAFMHDFDMWSGGDSEYAYPHALPAQ